MSFPEIASTLGGIGDFLSSIAVLITLIYLATQVRQARLEASLRGRQARANHTSAVLAPIISADGLAPIFAKLGMLDYGDFGLTREESIRFGAWFHTWLQTEQGSYYLLPEGENDPLLMWMLSTPAGAEFWNKNRGIYDHEFREHVDALKRELEATPLSETEVLAGGKSAAQDIPRTAT